MHCIFIDNSETRNWAKIIWVHFQQSLVWEIPRRWYVDFTFYWMNILTTKILHNLRINIREKWGEIISRFHLYGVVIPDIILWTKAINNFNAFANLWTHFSSVCGVQFKLCYNLFLLQEHSLWLTWKLIQR